MANPVRRFAVRWRSLRRSGCIHSCRGQRRPWPSSAGLGGCRGARSLPDRRNPCFPWPSWRRGIVGHKQRAATLHCRGRHSASAVRRARLDDDHGVAQTDDRVVPLHGFRDHWFAPTEIREAPGALPESAPWHGNPRHWGRNGTAVTLPQAAEPSSPEFRPRVAGTRSGQRRKSARSLSFRKVSRSSAASPAFASPQSCRQYVALACTCSPFGKWTPTSSSKRRAIWKAP